MASVLLAVGAFGLLVLLVQRAALALALRRGIDVPRRRPPLSILKPLCGLEDQLEANLESFARLDYPDFEVLLGVKDHLDPAWPLACAMAVRDRRFRVVLQRGEAGLNPKVNQLVTLAEEARHELLLVSDSNARLPVRALDEVAALFEDPRVACVSHPVSGLEHASFGSLLDNLHLVSGIGAAQLGAKLLANRALVVGKSMALRRSALDALGGFAAYADVLAEDYVLGRDLTAAGHQVRIARTPVWNVSSRRSVKSFFSRYLRWGVIHRTAVSLPTSLAQGLLHPLAFFALAVVFAPSARTLTAFGAALLIKTALDVSCARALRCDPIGWRAIPAVLVKDLLLFITWSYGQFVRTVDWRGNRLRVGARSRLLHPPFELRPASVEVS